MKIPMIVTKPFRPTGSGSRMLEVGETFHADKQQARLFRALGRVEDAPAAAAGVQAQRPVALHVPAEPPAAVIAAPAQADGETGATGETADAPAPDGKSQQQPEQPKDDELQAAKPRRRNYLRRDLTADTE